MMNFALNSLRIPLLMFEQTGTCTVAYISNIANNKLVVLEKNCFFPYVLL